MNLPDGFPKVGYQAAVEVHSSESVATLVGLVNRVMGASAIGTVFCKFSAAEFLFARPFDYYAICIVVIHPRVAGFEM